MSLLLGRWLLELELRDGTTTGRRLRGWADSSLEYVTVSSREQYKSIWHRKARIQDLDPDQIHLDTDSEDQPYLTIYTKFFREVVAERSLTIHGVFSRSTYRRGKNREYMELPLRQSLAEADILALKSELQALQARHTSMVHPLGDRYVSSLRQRVKELKVLVEGIANHVDFTAHAGAGVVEQHLSLCPDTLTLTLWQLRKHAADSPGSRITSVIPLHILARDIYLYGNEPNPNPGAMGRGIPPARVVAQCDHVQIRQHFANPDKDFEIECRSEDIFVPTLEDVIRFGRGLEDLIAAARELKFYGN